MKKITISIICCLLLSTFSYGQINKKRIKLRQVNVIAKRPFKETGVVKTEIDTIILRESITNSIANILSQNTSIFIKSYGRGSLASASFRGTAPSHTQVLWNGLKINSPMLGMVDFSQIPAYFVDDMSLWHGSSSVNVVGGALGGAICLNNVKPEKGTQITLSQGYSSYNTIDDFLKIKIGGDKFSSSTRISYAKSDNEFKYTNYNKKNFPIEKNKNGNFEDIHILQEFYYKLNNSDKLSLAAWVFQTKRGVPMLNVNYNDKDSDNNLQKDQNIRVVSTWKRSKKKLSLESKLGFSTYDSRYTLNKETGNGLKEVLNSHSQVYTGFINFGADYFFSDKFMLSSKIDANYHKVDNYEEYDEVGYKQERPEITAFIAARYKLTNRIRLALNIREDYYDKFTPIIPAFFFEYNIIPKINFLFKSSISKNYHYPTFNDLYFLPGGNPDLKEEEGITYDCGFEFEYKIENNFSFKGEITAYNSNINNWIIWLPTFKGFWEPHNVKKVHSYGLELKGKLYKKMGDLDISLNGNWANTQSINQGNPVNWADKSVGKQLVYIPEYSSSVSGNIQYKGFSLLYKYNYYSERFTTSSNNKKTRIGRITPYYMSDINISKNINTKLFDVNVKLLINNLYDEEYESVLSRPMAGRNYGIFIAIKI